jgi:hypothetical protein
MAVVAEVAECAVVINEGGGCGLSAAHADVHGAFPALDAQPSTVVPSYHRVSELPALGALLERGRVSAVTAMTDRPLGAPGNDALALTLAPRAGFAFAASGVARTAEPPLRAELPQVRPDLSAVCASGTDHRVPGIMQDFSEPKQDRWTERAA